MGIFEWVKSQTGIWGPVLLDAYLQNSGWINALVLAYGLVLWLSWQNLSRMHEGLVTHIVDQARARNQTERRKEPVRLSELPWKEAAAYSRFPFIAKQTGILLHRSTPENLRALSSERDLARRCAARLQEIGLLMELEK